MKDELVSIIKKIFNEIDSLKNFFPPINSAGYPFIIIFIIVSFLLSIFSDFSSQLVAVRQDFVVNYGDLRETYGSECTNASRRAEFNDTYVIPFNKRLVVLANKLHS